MSLTQIDSLTPVAMTTTPRNLYVVYRSGFSLYLRTYATPDPLPAGGRRRAAP